MAGFFARNFIWIGNGQSNTQNAVNICKGCAKAIIRTGWRLDSSKHSDIDDIKEHGTGNNYFCWYCLRSKTKNAKLLVCYTYRYRVVPMAQNLPYGVISNNYMAGGLGLSMIPDGSESEFGDDPTSESVKFIPDDATYLRGDISENSNYATTPAYTGTNGRQYEYMFVSDGEEVIFIFNKLGASGNYIQNCGCLGKIIGTLSYPELDVLPTAKHGWIQLSEGMQSSNTGYWQLRYATYSANSFLDNATQCGTHLFLPNGSRYVFSGSASTSNVQIFTDFTITRRVLVSSYNNGQRRWSPFGIGIFNANTATGQVIHGADGFKGYVDTNIMRYVGNEEIATEQLLDDGGFIHLDKGIAIAWDASNRIKITAQNSSIDTRNWNGGADPFA